jgi:hypothetical protein
VQQIRVQNDSNFAFSQSTRAALHPRFTLPAQAIPAIISTPEWVRPLFSVRNLRALGPQAHRTQNLALKV